MRQHNILLPRSKCCINPTMWRQDMAKNDFQYDVRPPSWIGYDVIILRTGTILYVPNIELNFKVDWFSIFWYT